MARDNYSYKKYRRELAKKKKKEEKMQRKLDRKNIQLKEGSGQVSGEDTASGSGVPPAPTPPSNGTMP